jgi:hypothetical protein
LACSKLNDVIFIYLLESDRKLQEITAFAFPVSIYCGVVDNRDHALCDVFVELKVVRAFGSDPWKHTLLEGRSLPRQRSN